MIKINEYYGTHHPSFLSGLNNLGVIYKKMNKLDNSLEILEKVCQGYNNLFGEEHKSTITSQ